jgi:hypothetical protein
MATTEVEDVDGGLLEGCWQQGPAAATTELEDVDGGPPGVLAARSGSDHH